MTNSDKRFTSLRFVLRQPSPRWQTFRLEDIKLLRKKQQQKVYNMINVFLFISMLFIISMIIQTQDLLKKKQVYDYLMLIP